MKLWNIAVNFGPAASSWEQRAADRVEVNVHGDLVGYQVSRVGSETLLLALWAFAPGVWTAFHTLERVKEERMIS